MKAIILLTVLITSLSSFGADLAHYRFGISGDQRGEFHVLNATLSDDKTLTVKMITTVGRPPFYRPVDPRNFMERKEEVTLNSFTFKELKNLVNSLSTAEIVEEKNEPICLMMPQPNHSNNHLSAATITRNREGTSIGQMRLILGPQGCWVRFETKPKDIFHLERANQLKQALKILSLNTMFYNL